MSIEKFAEHLKHYTITQTWGVGDEATTEKALNYLSDANPLEYRVSGRNEEDLALVQEISHNGKISFWLKNYYLGGMRKMDLHVMDVNDKLVFSIDIPGSIFHYKAKIFDLNHRPLGTIKKIFNPFLRTYHLRSRNSRSSLTIKAPIYRPWTFPVHDFKKKEIGKITKKFPTVGQFMTYREALDVKCSSLNSPEERCMILAAALLITIDH